jgi:CHASE2 domain-containing sensor protein
MKTAWRKSPAFAAGLGLLICIICLVTVTRTAWYSTLREQSFDAVLRLTVNRQISRKVVVVDIGRQSLQSRGSWPWSRKQLSHLINVIAKRRAHVIGLDLLISSRNVPIPDQQLSGNGAQPDGDIEQRPLLAKGDGDDQLAAALAAVPTVLGLGLDPDKEGGLQATTPVFIEGGLDFSSFWIAPDAIGPDPILRKQADGLGVLAIPGDGVQPP